MQRNHTKARLRKLKYREELRGKAVFAVEQCLPTSSLSVQQRMSFVTGVVGKATIRVL